jgi:hypothetical protein
VTELEGGDLAVIVAAVNHDENALFVELER